MKILLENFRSHTRSEYTFPDSGLTLLSGQSGSGKSTILTAVLFALYGRVRKPYTFGKKTCKVSLEMFDMNIVRTRSPNRLLVTLKDKTYEDDEAQGVIDSHMNTSYEEFLCSSYIRQKENASIVSMNQTEQIALIERVAFQDSKHTFYKDSINALVKVKTTKLADIESKIDISNENLSRLKSKSREFTVKSPPVKEGESMDDNDERIKNVKVDITSLNSEKEEIRESIRSTEKIKHEMQSLLDEKRTLQGKQSAIQSQIDFLSFEELNHEEISTMECRITELEKEYDQAKTYALGKELWREYKVKAEEKMEEYDSKIKEYKAKLLSPTEKKHIESTIKNAHVIDDNGLTPQEARAKLMLLTREIRTEYKTNNLKTVSSTVTYLKKRCSTLREDIVRNEDLLKEYRTEAAKASITSITYECPCCKEKLLVEEDKLIKYVERENVNYEEMVSNTIIALTNGRAAISKIEQWIHDMKEYARISSFKETVTKSKMDELKAKITVDGMYRKSYEEYKEMYENETLPDSIERLSSIALEIFIEHDRSSNSEERSKTPQEIKKNIDNLATTLQKQYTARMNFNTLKSELDETIRSIRDVDRKLKSEGNPSKELKNLNVTLLNVECRINDAHAELERLTNLGATIKQYRMYESHVKEIEYVNGMIDAFDRDRKILEKEIEACNLLKRCVLDAEILALQRTIYDINEYSKYYLDLMFEKTPIVVELKSIKYSKDTSKFQLNVNIEYKGETYDNINQLSGGERDRVNLAFILGVNTMLKSRILMLDECLASLDGETNTEILEFLKDISDNRSILVVSHEAIRGVFDEVVEI